MLAMKRLMVAPWLDQRTARRPVKRAAKVLEMGMTQSEIGIEGPTTAVAAKTGERVDVVFLETRVAENGLGCLRRAKAAAPSREMPRPNRSLSTGRL